MQNSEIRIFYSWQSDLPSGATRNLIQDSIDSVVKSMRDIVPIIADRDTKGEFGTPDITETIFSKIEECDIFVADVSIINKYHSIDDEGNALSNVKTAPNPNVLFELGYAARTIGWENIICIMNTDYGRIEELPFDIRHRRPYAYSLEENEKSNVRKDIRDIISSTVMNIVENGKRSKGTFSEHYLGIYNFENDLVEKKLIPFRISELGGYNYLRETYLTQCKGLIEEIVSIKLEKQQSSDTLENKVEKDAFKLSVTLNIFGTYKPVVIPDKKREEIQKDANTFLSIELDDSFFDMGALQRKYDALNQVFYQGTDEEKEKYNKFCDLSYIFGKLSLLNLFIKTFDEMYIIPLAIFNQSNYVDKNITITITMDPELTVIEPNAKLFNEEITGLEGNVVEEDFINLLFMMPTSENIGYDYDISYDAITERKRMADKNAPLGLNSWAEFDEEDYERELKRYIAVPLEEEGNVFTYHIDNLRAKETKWIGAAILVRSKDDTFHLSYSIKSDNSNGELKGELHK